MIAAGELNTFVGFQVQNNIKAPTQTTPGGENVSSDTRNDVKVTSAELTMFDGDGAQLATETVLANGYAPAGGQGVVLFNFLGKPFADALRQHPRFPAEPSDNFLGRIEVVFKGEQVSGGGVETGPFDLPLDVHYLDVRPLVNDYRTQGVVLLPDGGDPSATGVAFGAGDVGLLPDGGLVSFVYFPDGGFLNADGTFNNYVPSQTFDDGGFNLPDGGRFPGVFVDFVSLLRYGSGDGGLSPISCE